MTQLHSPEIERNLLLAQNALTQLGQHISQAAAAVVSLGPERQTALARELWSELSGLVSSVDELMVSVFAARALFLLFSLRPLLTPPPLPHPPIHTQIVFNSLPLAGRPINSFVVFPTDRSRYTRPTPLVVTGAYSIIIKKKNA